MSRTALRLPLLEEPTIVRTPKYATVRAISTPSLCAEINKCMGLVLGANGATHQHAPMPECKNTLFLT